MTPDAMAALHARCFTTPRPWRAEEFAACLADPMAIICCRQDGFLIGRRIGPEAELLTLAVAPEARRQGVARALLAEFVGAVRAQGAQDIFLEVAADNIAARALYKAHGFAETGIRKGYYRTAGKAPIDAIQMVFHDIPG